MVNTQKPKKIKWNKSQLIESDTYVRALIKSLSNHFGPAERQEIYFISKIFVDGTIEVTKNRFNAASHFFNRGESMLAKLEEGSIKKKMLLNIYDRSKSLYYYRTGELDKAVELIHNALQTNTELESQGFPFMMFDRFSQYHNLSKIYFSQQQPEKGISLLQDVICFLMTGQPNAHIAPIDGFPHDLEADGTSMRSSLICLLLFETIGKMQADKDVAAFIHNSKPFVSAILDATENYTALTKVDQAVKDWLAVVQHFYRNDFREFNERCRNYLATAESFYGENPAILLRQYVEYVPVKEVLEAAAR